MAFIIGTARTPLSAMAGVARNLKPEVLGAAALTKALDCSGVGGDIESVSLSGGWPMTPASAKALRSQLDVDQSCRFQQVAGIGDPLAPLRSLAEFARGGQGESAGESRAATMARRAASGDAHDSDHFDGDSNDSDDDAGGAPVTEHEVYGSTPVSRTPKRRPTAVLSVDSPLQVPHLLAHSRGEVPAQVWSGLGARPLIDPLVQWGYFSELLSLEAVAQRRGFADRRNVDAYAGDQLARARNLQADGLQNRLLFAPLRVHERSGAAASSDAAVSTLWGSRDRYAVGNDAASELGCDEPLERAHDDRAVRGARGLHNLPGATALFSSPGAGGGYQRDSVNGGLLLTTPCSAGPLAAGAVAVVLGRDATQSAASALTAPIRIAGFAEVRREVTEKEEERLVDGSAVESSLDRVDEAELRTRSYSSGHLLFDNTLRHRQKHQLREKRPKVRSSLCPFLARGEATLAAMCEAVDAARHMAGRPTCDVYEISDAPSALTAIGVQRMLNLDPDKVNPLGSSAARGSLWGGSGMLSVFNAVHSLSSPNYETACAVAGFDGHAVALVLTKHHR